ncbi:MAG TPA: fibrobacter succinogenes major paralogous domain-containing protein, partial [Bacteroidales bacterium]|nr:fibrobacter succinogenes major paralogous domain-containing protein [Bacteroidales bacterium]
MQRIILIFICLLFVMNNRAQTVTDYDGNVYSVIVIGSQAWLKENLKTTHYRNGVVIPHIPGGANWASLTSGARCYYDNDSSSYDSVYGVLYNWFTVNNSNGLCPEGWHVPTDAEWQTLVEYLG